MSMKRNITKERYIEVMRNGSEKDAERLCYDLLFEDLDSIFERKQL